MDIAWLDDYLLAKPGVEKDYKPEWDANRFLLEGKMLAMQGGDKAGNPIITLKAEPALGQLLREQYPGKITAGYYMNKEHWNSVYVESDVPDAVLRDLCDESYRLILSSLPKKLREKYAAETAK